jgi:hypothetical protein
MTLFLLGLGTAFAVVAALALLAGALAQRRALKKSGSMFAQPGWITQRQKDIGQ